jgi:ankyrin repeat protein
MLDIKEDFVSKLKPIKDFTDLEEGTLIFSSHANNPLNYDYFLRKTTYFEKPAIKYHNPLEGNDYTSSDKGWYFWDKELAFKVLSDKRDRFNRTLLMNGITHNKQDIVDYFLENNLLLDARDNDGRTTFHYAAKEGNLKACKHIQSMGLDMNALDNYEQNALHYAAYVGGSAIIPSKKESALKNSFETVNFLIDAGLNINAKDDIDDTPLNNSIYQDINNFDVAKLLVDKGAEINHINKDNRTPLIFSALKNHVDITALLLENNADINIIDCQGKRAVDYITSNEMIDLFEQYTHKMDFETESTFRATALKQMLTK